MERAPSHGYLTCDSSCAQAPSKTCLHVILLCFTWSISLSNLRRQFLVLSTVGLHVRTVAERKASMSTLPLLETAKENPAMHQALMLKPKWKKKIHTFFQQCHSFPTRVWDFTPSLLQYPFFTGSKENSQEPFYHLTQLVPFQLLQYPPLCLQIKVTNFCRELCFGMALQRQETQGQPMASFGNKLMLAAATSQMK